MWQQQTPGNHSDTWVPLYGIGQDGVSLIEGTRMGGLGETELGTAALWPGKLHRWLKSQVKRHTVKTKTIVTVSSSSQTHRENNKYTEIEMFKETCGMMISNSTVACNNEKPHGSHHTVFCQSLTPNAKSSYPIDNDWRIVCKVKREFVQKTDCNSRMVTAGLYDWHNDFNVVEVVTRAHQYCAAP